MAATATHTYFARDVFDVLPEDICNRLDINKLEAFSQGTDPLMFFNVMNLRKGKNIRVLQKISHQEKTKDFFINLVKNIKDSSLYYDYDVCSFLSGMICHYSLDSILHPFVIYKCGQFKKFDTSTYKYNGIHSFMESYIDIDMIKKREKVDPYKFDVSNMCFNNIKYSKDLSSIIDKVFFDTYSVSNVGEAYYKSLNDMKKFLHLFRYDKYGLKKNIYKIIDTFTTKKSFRFESLSYHFPLNKGYDFLNNNHKKWYNPMDNNISSNSSFIELYLRAIKLAKIIIEGVFLYLDGEDIELDALFLNKSLITGLDCDDGVDFKYFEF